MGSHWKALEKCRKPYYLNYRDNVREFIDSSTLGSVYAEISTVNDQVIIDRVRQSGSEFAFFIAFGEIVKKETLDQIGCKIVNFHSGLLPETQGADVNKYVIRDGLNKTGITLHYMSDIVDGGDIIVRRQLSEFDGDEDYNLLQAKLGYLAASAIYELHGNLTSKDFTPIKQDRVAGKYLKRMGSECEIIDFSVGSEQILRTVRCYSNTMSTAYFCHKGFKIFVGNGRQISKTVSCKLENSGQVIDTGLNFIIVTTKDFDILLENILVGDYGSGMSAQILEKILPNGSIIEPACELES